MLLWLQGLYQLVLLIFFQFVIFLKISSYTYYMKFVLGKKNSYNFIFLVMKVTAFVTL